MKALMSEQQRLVPEAGTWFLTFLTVFYRFGAAALVLALLLRGDIRKISRLEVEQGLVLAFFGAGGIMFQLDGLAYTSASTSAFLTQTHLVFLVLWVTWRQRRRPATKTLCSVGLVLVGVAVLARIDFTAIRLGRGEIETMIAAVMFAGGIICLDHPRYVGNKSLSFSLVMFAGMAALALPGLWLTAPSIAAVRQAYASPGAVMLLATLVFACTLGGYLLMNRWQRLVPATEAGVIYSVEPVLASLLALFLPAWISVVMKLDYPNEVLTTPLVIGGGLITAANLLLQKR